MHKEEKRGISSIVATVLIILITVAAVAIVWTAVIPMIKKQTEESAKFSQVDVSIETLRGYTYYDPNRNLVSIQVRNTGEKKVEKIKIILENTYGNTDSFTQDFNAEKNQLKTFVLPVSEKPVKVSVAPVLFENKKEIEKEISSSVELKQGSSSGGIQFSGVYQGLVSWWKFENISNIGKDSIGNNNGVVYGGVSSSEGRNGIGKSASFDGDGDYVNVGNNNNLDFGTSQDFSVCFWMKSQTASRIISKRASGQTGWMFRNSGTKVQFHMANISYQEVYSTSTTNVYDNSWYSICGSANRNANMTLYINGILEHTNVISSLGNISTTTTMRIGMGDGAGNYFNGSIDEVMIFNRALSQSEVRELYNSQK